MFKIQWSLSRSNGHNRFKTAQNEKNDVFIVSGQFLRKASLSRSFEILTKNFEIIFQKNQKKL